MGKQVFALFPVLGGNMTYVLLAEAGHFVSIVFPELLWGKFDECCVGG